MKIIEIKTRALIARKTYTDCPYVVEIFIELEDENPKILERIIQDDCAYNWKFDGNHATLAFSGDVASESIGELFARFDVKLRDISALASKMAKGLVLLEDVMAIMEKH